MKNRRMVCALIFFLVVAVETYAVTLPDHVYKVNENGQLIDPDLNYYVAGGKFGTGHDLTIAISQPLAQVSIYLLPITFFSIFVVGTYYFIGPFTKYPEWAFLMAPLTLLTTILAQIFSTGLFWFVLGFYFRYKQTLKRNYLYLIGIFLFLACLAHFWSGICIVGLFGLFMLIEKKWRLIILAAPALCVLALVGLAMRFTPGGMFTANFLQYAPGEIPTFFYLFTRGMGFLFSASVGMVWLALYKEYSLLKIIVSLLLIPIGLMLVLPFDWVWRLFYFMPLLALTSIVMSYVFEGRKLKIKRG